MKARRMNGDGGVNADERKWMEGEDGCLVSERRTGHGGGAKFVWMCVICKKNRSGQVPDATTTTMRRLFWIRAIS